ncbi:hypothetical protein LCGC14_2774300, partial [marine sediment metagenome]
QDELRSKVTGAMIYPVMLATFAVAAVLIMLIWLVPKFKDFLADMPLPLPSKILFGLSEMLLGHWPVMLVGLVLAAAGIWGGLRSEAGRRLWSQWKLRIPVAGRAIRMVAITRFCRVFGTMLANGINILQALAISKDATGNALMADGNGGEVRSDLLVEAVAVHAEIAGRVPKAHQAGQEKNGFSRCCHRPTYTAEISALACPSSLLIMARALWSSARCSHSAFVLCRFIIHGVSRR